GLPVVNEDGTPKWRMAPSPRGAYWDEGMKLGYQDAGSWTLLKSTPDDRRKAAWLYAQFTVSKSVSLKKTLTGLTPIRQSDLDTPEMLAAAPKLGGLVEFYRSPAREAWTPTGVNVPDYPKLAQLWWENIGAAAAGEKTPQEAMDALADAQDKVLTRLERSGAQPECAPKMATRKDIKGAEYWLAQPGAPKPKLDNEKPKGETVPYDNLLQAWQEGRAR
ncbi:MAG: ABC transporter substrate-binding protein, partial [Gammaproteobacteria bacterium]|nr:ABC transporter substrate-binding protein [Gammaproteobacteria bacterium]